MKALGGGTKGFNNLLNYFSGNSNEQCGWDFKKGLCVPSSTMYVNSDPIQGNILSQMCQESGYWHDGHRPPHLPSEVYVDTPRIECFQYGRDDVCGCLADARCTIDLRSEYCTAHSEPAYTLHFVNRTDADVQKDLDDNSCIPPPLEEICGNISDVCECNSDPRCVSLQDGCYEHRDNTTHLERNRTKEEINEDLIFAKCGDTYCVTLDSACACYNSATADGGLCGWDGSKCLTSLVSNPVDMYMEHCCDIFQTPCECKIGRLPPSGSVDFSNHCGWDDTVGVCRLSAVTTADEITKSNCSGNDSCILVDTESQCDQLTDDCYWEPNTHTCLTGALAPMLK